MKLYEYAVLFEPSEKDEENGLKPQLLVPITTELVAGEEQVKIIASRAIPEDYLDKLDRVVVAVRPF